MFSHDDSGKFTFSLNYHNIRYQLECLECLQEMFYFYSIMSMLNPLKIEKFICIPKVRSAVTSNTFTCVFGYNLCKCTHLTALCVEMMGFLVCRICWTVTSHDQEPKKNRYIVFSRKERLFLITVVTLVGKCVHNKLFLFLFHEKLFLWPFPFILDQGIAVFCNKSHLKLWVVSLGKYVIFPRMNHWLWAHCLYKDQNYFVFT